VDVEVMTHPLRDALLAALPMLGAILAWSLVLALLAA